MFVIITWNGVYESVGFCLQENGETALFNSIEEAEAYAKEDCAFNYKIVQI